MFNRFVFIFIIAMSFSGYSYVRAIPISMRNPEAFMVESGLRTGFKIGCSDVRDTLSRWNSIGSFIPQCKSGYVDQFESKQCHGSTGFCWCSDSSGKRLSEKFRAWENDGIKCETDK